MLGHILFMPIRYVGSRSIKKQISALVEKLGKLMMLYFSSSSLTVNPTQLRKQISDLEEDDIHVKPAVYSILDKAIQRDPAIFTVDTQRE
jgi:hypothetical protein